MRHIISRFDGLGLKRKRRKKRSTINELLRGAKIDVNSAEKVEAVRKVIAELFEAKAREEELANSVSSQVRSE